LLQHDLRRLFEYIEPTDRNACTHSLRVHEILLRACIEVEANCKAILLENGYQKKQMTMKDYRKIEKSHRLSAFKVKAPFWRGASVRRPFESFGAVTPAWYKAYNATKHDRHIHFKQANLQNAIDAVAGVQVLLCAQFVLHEFDPVSFPLRGEHDSELFFPAQGSFFMVRFPDDWPEEEKYDLADWEKTQAIQPYPYPP
jgi:hypothetical protein